MKKCLLIIFAGFVSLQLTAQMNTQQVNSGDKVKAKADQISTRLKLEESQYKSVYNIVDQADKRIADLELGAENYGKLLGYINEEREEMLKAALTPEQFKDYQKYFSTKDMAEITALSKKNDTFTAKKKANEERDKKQADALMKKEKDKQLQEEKKQKELAKREEEKRKALEKREAEKQKAAEKKEAEKQKAEAKKVAEKEKAAAKKEREAQKRAEQKEKERLKKEEAKQKALEKKLQTQRKALEKKK